VLSICKNFRKQYSYTKKAMTRAAGVVAMATKRAMATNGNNKDNGYGKEGGRRLTAVTMVMGMETAQRTRLLAG
jgi:hypothetical protein